jgi:uncharacterized protein (TIGR02757 family)
MISSNELSDFLETKFQQYHQVDFIASDPISIPHEFSRKEDIEIAAFLTATIAWGQRLTIIKNAKKLMEQMDHAPYDFILNHTSSNTGPFKDFKHRTFNGVDLLFFFRSLQNIYRHHGGLEAIMSQQPENMKTNLRLFRSVFFELPFPQRTAKHLANPTKGSAAKRLNMFLRWMVRDNTKGVDFGLWKNIHPSQLYMPLDVHTGNVSRKLGLLERTQNDWEAVRLLTERLRTFDKSDPIKYDYALFGLGVFEGF